MGVFLNAYYDRAADESHMEVLLADVEIQSDGGPLDPAAWEDFRDAVDVAEGQ